MALANQDLMAAVAVTRFGLGAKPGELAAAKSDPQGFLKAQIRRTGADQPSGQPASTAQRMAEFRDFRWQLEQGFRRDGFGNAGGIHDTAPNS